MRRDMSRHPWIIRTLMTLILLSGSAHSLAEEMPIKSPNDDKAYRSLTLNNGLKVLLISDPDTDKAAAALDVAVGSGDDPADRPGLAHFLEHMLFLGTEKYPEPGAYQQFISSHGGGHNAFTAFRDTNYFFDIQAKYLEDALDRFDQQFVAPLFTEDLVDRERQAVHSEFSSKLKTDPRRFLSARKAVTNPEHAFSQFATGNAKTLSNSSDNKLRKELIQFWKAHYSANLMTLVVYGKQDLDELESMVRPRFTRITNRNLAPNNHREPLFEPEFLPARLQVQAEKETREMTLSFPMPSLRDEYADKPGAYIANLLGHEGPGSLLAVLRDANLAESLSAGAGQDLGAETTFNIRIGLTPEGLKKQGVITNLTFNAIEKIRQHGIRKHYYQELKQLNDIDFRFQDERSPRQTVTHLAMQLQDIPAKDVLRAPWMIENFSPGKYRDVLSHLTPDNVLVSVLSPESLSGDVPRTEWYDTPYEVQSLDTDQLLPDRSTPLAKQLELPEPNPFIPEDFELVSGETMAHPEKLTSESKATLWYARDTRFSTPRARLYLSLRTPLVRQSARNAVLMDLFVETVRDNLNAYSYAASLAGLDYTVYSHLRGMTVRVGGYSDKLHVLLRRVLSSVAEPRFQQKEFAINRQALIDNLVNHSRKKPVQQASRVLQEALIEGVWPVAARLKAARDITLDDLRAFADRLLVRLDPVMLAHGNLTEAGALNLHRQTEALLLKETETMNVPRGGIHALDEGKSRIDLNVEHPDKALIVYHQGDTTTYPERAQYRLLAQLVSSPFYTELRTRQQLGYIVSASSWEIMETPGLGFLVQSPSARPDDITDSVHSFIQSFHETLTGLEPEALKREKQAVISRLMEKDRKLGKISERYWREIDRGNANFDSREKLAEAIRQTTKEDLVRVWKNRIVPQHKTLRVGASSALETDRHIVRELQDAAFVY